MLPAAAPALPALRARCPARRRPACRTAAEWGLGVGCAQLGVPRLHRGGCLEECACRCAHSDSTCSVLHLQATMSSASRRHSGVVRQGASSGCQACMACPMKAASSPPHAASAISAQLQHCSPQLHTPKGRERPGPAARRAAAHAAPVAKTLSRRAARRGVAVGTAIMLRRTATGALGALRRLGQDARLLSTSTSGGYKLIDHEFDAIVVGAGKGGPPVAQSLVPRDAQTPSAERPPPPSRTPDRRWRRSARGGGPERGGLQHSVSGGGQGRRLPLAPLVWAASAAWVAAASNTSALPTTP